MDRLISIDQHITSILNGWNAAALDPVMIFVSKVYVWVPLYLAIIVWYFAKQPWRRAMLTVAMLILAFAFTDRFSYFLKESICRLRPCEDPAMAGPIRLLEKHGSLHGFPSGHATNTFCFALLTSLTARRKWWTPAIFSWAAIVSYSRIYVGKHYFGDVLCGALLGLLCGYIFYLIIKAIDKYALHSGQGN